MAAIFGLLFLFGLNAAPATATKAATSKKVAPGKGSATKGKSSFASSKKAVHRPAYGPWREPTYADSTEGDFIDGEDLQVRRAAVDALGPLNGTVVVADVATGRVLTIVNQKVTFKGGYTPCSTIKPFVGMGALAEGVIDRETIIKVNRRLKYNLTEALAKSDNPFFAILGQRLGFERVSYYARLFGLGERAVLALDLETPGTLPLSPPENGGVGMMSSFGEGIKLTTLQLAAALGAVANGGTLNYLQYPRSRAEVNDFIPRVKRHIDIQEWIPELKPGLLAAVDHGTARRAGFGQDEALFGKTGTCTDRGAPTHLGWFGSFNDAPRNRIAVVVLLTGGKPINGPVASGVAGTIYRTLSWQGYFGQERPVSPVALMGPRLCCLQ